MYITLILKVHDAFLSDTSWTIHAWSDHSRLPVH